MTAHLFVSQLHVLSILCCAFFLLGPQQACQDNLYAQTAPEYELKNTERTEIQAGAWFFLGKVGEPDRAVLALQDGRLNQLRAGASHLAGWRSAADILSVVFSRHKQYFAVMRLAAGTANQVTKTLEVTVYTAIGERVFSIHEQQYYDDSYPVLQVSDNLSALVLARNTVGTLRFYDNTGELVRSIKVLPNARYDLERALVMDMTSSGDRLAVITGSRDLVTTARDVSSASYTTEIVIFDEMGEEVRRSRIAGEIPSTVAIDGNGEYLAAASYAVGARGNIRRQSILFDNHGKVTTELNMLPKHMVFSGDSRYLLLAENQQVRLISTAGGKTIWKESIDRSEGFITTTCLANDASVAAILIAKNAYRASGFIFSTSKLFMRNRNGERLQTFDLSGMEFVTPALELSADSQQLSIGFTDSFRVYAKPE